MPDNISRFPYSGPRHYAPVVSLTKAEIAKAEADFLQRWALALPQAREAVAEETARIIAASREQRGRQTVAACREDERRVVLVRAGR